MFNLLIEKIDNKQNKRTNDYKYIILIKAIV